VEAQEHWVRGIQNKVAGLNNAANQLERIAKPVVAEARVEHLPVERLVENYQAVVRASIAKYQVQACPFTNVSAKEMFGLASRYVVPFEFEQEGKGFQDAVILSSVLQHLKSNPQLIGILVTADGVFSKAKVTNFEAGIPEARLRILDLDSTFGLVWEPYWDENVTRPYATERENAKTAAEALIPTFKEFITSHISDTMLKAGTFDKVLKVVSVDDIKVIYVQTPLPDPARADREVRMAIAVSVECTAIVEKDYSFVHSFLKWKGEPPKPVEEEEKLTWLGGVEVTADVVDRQFRNLRPTSLLSVEQLGSGKWWK